MVYGYSLKLQKNLKHLCDITFPENAEHMSLCPNIINWDMGQLFYGHYLLSSLESNLYI